MSNFSETWKKIMKARKVIMDKEGEKCSVSGKIKCPICEAGDLRYSIGFNGHVHARCSTANCVQWME
jgi:transposase-like protein